MKATVGSHTPEFQSQILSYNDSNRKSDSQPNDLKKQLQQHR